MFSDGSDIENQGDESYGSVSMITATQDSINTAYIDLTESMEDGPQKVVDTAVDMGIPPAEPPKEPWGFPTTSGGLLPNAGVALGSQTVSPINMANGYATIANGGVAAEPFIIEKVVDQNGEKRYDHKVQDHRALPEDIAADVSYAMQQVVEAGSGAAALSRLRLAGGGQDRHRDQRRRRGLVGVVRRVHRPVLHGRDVRPRQGQRAAARLAARVLRRRLPRAHVARGHGHGDGGRGADRVPAAGVRRRRGTGGRPRALHAAPAAAVHQDAEHRPSRTTDPTTEEPSTDPTTQPPSSDPTSEPPSSDPTSRTADAVPTTADDAADDARHPDDRRGAGSTVAPGSRPASGPPRSRLMTHVHPTRDDRVVAAVSEVVGGPVGEHAGRHRWWTPARVLLLLTAITFVFGMVQKAPCSLADGKDQPWVYSHMCYTDLRPLYVPRGLAELSWPYSDDEETRDRYEVMEYPVGISYWAYGAAWVTQVLNGSPDRDARADQPVDELYASDDVDRELTIFVLVNAVGFAALALLSVWLLSKVDRGRPWDAAAFALSPTLLLTGLINWDLIAVALVAAALWSWSRDHPVADRRTDRARHRGEALSAVPARRAAHHLHPAAQVRRVRARHGLGRGHLGGGQPPRLPQRHRASGRCSGRSTPTAAPTWGRCG